MTHSGQHLHATLYHVVFSTKNRVACIDKERREHHRRLSFLEEFRVLLERQGISYDSQYLE